MTSPADQRVWTQRLWLLLAALFCWRAIYIAIVPLELCPDEAYYWDWSRQLDWGYYSKPPMIAWIIALATKIGGTSEFAVRLPAAILGTIGLWPVFALARSLFDARVGFWNVVALAATPGTAAMSLLMTIDAPFLCAWAFAVWCVWELFSPDPVPSPPSAGERVRVRGSSASERRPHSNPLPHRNEGEGTRELRWLIAAILSTGLGLLSKQSMLALFPLVLFWLASDSRGRRQLRRPTVWLWMGGSLLFLAPVVWWNLQHGWITLQHTREHFQTRAVSLGQHVVYFAEFWAGQFGVISPITCGLMIVLGLTALTSWPRLDQRVRYLVCLSAVPMLGVTALSFLQRVQPNWPAAFHLTAFVLLSAWGCGAWDWKTMFTTSECATVASSQPWFAWLCLITAAKTQPWHTHSTLNISQEPLRNLFRISIVVGAVLVIGVYAVPFAVPASSLAGGPLDATARLRGWKTLGLKVDEKLSEFPHPQEALVIAATSRGPVSALAYYLPGQPRVYRWNPTAIAESQHDVWGGPVGGLGDDVLIVTPRDCPVPTELALAFDSLESRGSVQVDLGGSRRETLSVWRGTGFRGWPTHFPCFLEAASSVWSPLPTFRWGERASSPLKNTSLKRKRRSFAKSLSL